MHGLPQTRLLLLPFMLTLAGNVNQTEDKLLAKKQTKCSWASQTLPIGTIDNCFFFRREGGGGVALILITAFGKFKYTNLKIFWKFLCDRKSVATRDKFSYNRLENLCQFGLGHIIITSQTSPLV